MTRESCASAGSARVHERIADGLEKDPLPGLDSYCAVDAVFKAHDLLTRC